MPLANPGSGLGTGVSVVHHADRRFSVSPGRASFAPAGSAYSLTQIPQAFAWGYHVAPACGLAFMVVIPNALALTFVE